MHRFITKYSSTLHVDNLVTRYDSVYKRGRTVWILFTFTFIRIFIQYCFCWNNVAIPENKMWIKVCNMIEDRWCLWAIGLTSGTFARGPYRWCSGWGLVCRGWCDWAARPRRPWWRQTRRAAAAPCSATWSACRRPSPCWTTTTTPCWRATPPSAPGRLRRSRPFPCPCTGTTHQLLRPASTPEQSVLRVLGSSVHVPMENNIGFCL